MIKKNKFIDLDLPSKTLWSYRNLGLKLGNLYSLDSFKFYPGDKEIQVENDIASKCFNDENIRIPSKKDFNELIRNTHTKWNNNPNGRWFFSKKDRNKKIFLPITNFSYYASRTSENNDTVNRGLWCIQINSFKNFPEYLYFAELFIRPVKYVKKNKA